MCSIFDRRSGEKREMILRKRISRCVRKSQEMLWFMAFFHSAFVNWRTYNLMCFYYLYVLQFTKAEWGARHESQHFLWFLYTLTDIFFSWNHLSSLSTPFTKKERERDHISLRTNSKEQSVYQGWYTQKTNKIEGLCNPKKYISINKHIGNNNVNL